MTVAVPAVGRIFMSSSPRLAVPRVSVALLLLAAVFQTSVAGAEEPPADSPPAAAAATAAVQDVAHFPRLVLIDLRDVLGAPLSCRSRQWELFGLSVAGIGAASLL